MAERGRQNPAKHSVNKLKLHGAVCIVDLWQPGYNYNWKHVHPLHVKLLYGFFPQETACLQ